MSKNLEYKYKLDDLYKFISKLGSGSFGEVWETFDIKTGKTYASKIEEKKDHSRLKYEYEIYKKLKKGGMKSGIPKIINYVEIPSHNLLIMQLLGSSLDKLLENNNGKFDIGTVLKLGIDIINLLKNMHELGFIHRDIKPNNFMVGYKDKKNELYILDFGLSKQFMVKEQHMGYRVEKNLVGTARYASINVHIGIEPSRRDDLEATGYMLVYFLKGKLPWQGLKEKKGVDKIKLIGDTKILTSLEKLCDGIPKCFIKYIKYCKELKFDETPDYELLKNLFLNEALENKIDIKYCWVK